MPDPFPGPFSREVQDDPYPCYRWLREQRPVYHNPWAVSRYADVVAVLRNHADFSSAEGVGLSRVRGQSMIAADPPNHTRLRGLVSRAFQPGMVERLAPRIEALCHELIDASAVARGSFDLMEDFAIPLPIRVIAELLGLDPARYPDYKRWTQALVESLGKPDSPEAQRNYAVTSKEFFNYLYRLCGARLRNPGSDLLTLLIQARVERDALQAQEVAYFCELLLIAGAETTTSLIGNTALALAANPDQAALVIERPELIPPMIEEALRWDGPFHGDFRTTTRAVALHGVEIPKGAKVALLLASANRDPDAFPEPDRFLVTRSPNQHLGFGHGIHYCIGAPLARLEARIAANVLLQRFRYLAPDPQHPPQRNYMSAMLRALRHLPLRFEFR